MKGNDDSVKYQLYSPVIKANPESTLFVNLN
ncbi:MAG: hypothetical protein FD170_1233 [Bacteroidetes bacterium]|nr:MAG: hypothetical protein FD170_1233 [Bacteroidota bacterium]